MRECNSARGPRAGCQGYRSLLLNFFPEVNVIRKTILGLGLCLLFLPGQARSQNQPEVFTETKHDVSPALRDIPQIAPSVGPKHEKPLRMTHGPGEFGPQLDPVLQSSAGAFVSTTAGLNFQGVGVGLGNFSDCCAPPDTNGAAGATQYVQWVNLSFAVFDKATGNVLLGPSAGNTLWTGFGGPCETSNDGDPIAQYDKAAGRWVLAQPVFTSPYMFCIAVSTTSHAAGSPDFFVNFGSNSLNVFRFHVDFANTANSTFTGPINIPVAAFTEACSGGACIQQPSTNQKLDSLADRLMYRLSYRNRSGTESLMVNHSVFVSGNRKSQVDGVRWYEIRSPNGAPAIFQQGTFSPDSNSRWMGGIAMDKVGDIAVGYSVSSSSLFPSIRFSGRVPTDPLGKLQAENTILNGAGSQLSNVTPWGGSGRARVDPATDAPSWD